MRSTESPSSFLHLGFLVAVWAALGVVEVDGSAVAFVLEGDPMGLVWCVVEVAFALAT